MSKPITDAFMQAFGIAAYLEICAECNKDDAKINAEMHRRLAERILAPLEVFPIKHNAKSPPQIDEFPTESKPIAEWAEAIATEIYGDCNWAIHCRGLVVVDVDVRSGGNETFAKLEQEHEFPATLMTRTPSTGRHYFYRLPEGHPGVPNGAGRLGDGIDIKSTGGYVVRAGSTIDGKEYVLEVLLPISPAPQWLLDKLGEAAPPSASKGVKVPDALPERVEQARDALSRREPAIEGQGGDLWTFKTFAMLRDYGLSLPQAIELAQNWNARCEPPWEPADLEVKARSAYKSARGEPGTRGTDRNDFPNLDEREAKTPTEPEGTTQGASRIRRVRSLVELQPGPQFWEGVVGEHGIFAICAVPGRSKSYTAAGLCYSIANDEEFLGRKLPKGTLAVYVDLERMPMTELRLSTWAREDERDAQAMRLVLIDGEVRLNTPDTIEQLVKDIRAAAGGVPVSLVIIDSLGAALPNIETNSASGASMAGVQLRRIRDSLDCVVGVVCHSPKSEERTVSGSVQFDAIFDTTLFVESDNGGKTGHLYIHKDNGLALEEHERKVGWIRDTVTVQLGERVIKVHRLSEGAIQSARSGPPEKGRNGKKTKARRAWEILYAMADRGAQVVPLDAWHEKLKTELGVDRSAWYDIKHDLSRHIVIDETEKTVRMAHVLDAPRTLQ